MKAGLPSLFVLAAVLPFLSVSCSRNRAPRSGFRGYGRYKDAAVVVKDDIMSVAEGKDVVLLVFRSPWSPCGPLHVCEDWVAFSLPPDFVIKPGAKTTLGRERVRYGTYFRTLGNRVGLMMSGMRGVCCDWDITPGCDLEIDLEVLATEGDSATILIAGDIPLQAYGRSHGGWPPSREGFLPRYKALRFSRAFDFPLTTAGPIGRDSWPSYDSGE
jgi:hypothetical protein